MKLFVYGTLGPGRPNEHVLKPIGGTWEKATVKGKLHQEGWGAAMGYPGIVLDKKGDSIEGFVFISDNLDKHWTSLDKFEGPAYQRVLTEFTFQNGQKDKAFIYVLNRQT